MLHIVEVLGMSYTGSTMLGLMLGSHSRIAMLGEVHSVSTVGCTVCRDGECSVWSDAFRASLSGVPGVHQRVANRIGVDYVVDTSKTPPPWSSWFKDTYDPAAHYVVVFLNKAPERIAASFALHRKQGQEAVDVMETWVAFDEMCSAYMEQMQRRGAQVLLMRYEDLALFPDRELRRVLKPLRLAYEPGQEQFWNYEHHQIGGNTRAVSNLSPLDPRESQIINESEPQNVEICVEQHRKISLDEKWRTVLLPEEVDKMWADERVVEVAQRWGYGKGGKLVPRSYWPREVGSQEG